MFEVVRATSIPLSASCLITPLGSCRQLLRALPRYRAALWKTKHSQKQLWDVQLTAPLSLAGAAAFHREKAGSEK